MVRPVPASIPVTLGYRQKMSSRPSYIHRGVDFGAPVGTTVVAAKSGRVVHAGYGGLGPACGLHVVIRTTDGIYVVTMHMSKVSVKVGASVTTGQTIGKSGATGNVTGPHVHYGELTAFNYLTDRKPRYLDDPAPKPTPPVPRYSRPPAGRQWFRASFWNLAGFDAAQGKKTAETRRLGMEAAVKAAAPHVAGFCEIGNPVRRGLWRYSMNRIGLKPAAEGRGRAVYYDPRVASKLDGGLWELNVAYRGDAKHAAWAVLKVQGVKTLVVAYHLENEDKTGKTQADQITEVIRRARARAKASKIGDDRIVLMGDDNHDLDDVCLRLGFVDAFRASKNQTRAASKSTTGWSSSTRTGGRIDKIRVGIKRPVLASNNLATGAPAVTDIKGRTWTPGQLSDHTMQVSVLALIGA